jgi:hypothetical protein
MVQMYQYVLRLANTDRQTYNICIEKSEQEAPEVVIMSICDERALYFHIAITCANTDIENAKTICSQAAIYYSTDDDPLLYFAVYDRYTQVLYFGLLDPEQKTYEDVVEFQMPWEENHVAARLQAYLASNAEVLQ